MAAERLHLTQSDLLDGAQRLLDWLETEFPDAMFANQHEVLLMAAYATIGPGGVRHCLEQST